MKKYPFKFLDAYNEQDKEIFFGRDEEIDALYKMAYQGDMLLVYGGSGTGKTSLINCGLASKFQSFDWFAINIRRGTNLNTSLEEKLQLAAGDSGPENFDLSWLDDDDEIEPNSALQSVLTKQFKALYLKYFRPIYLIFDQFEELYVLGTKEEESQFIQTVQEILEVEQPVKLIFIIREEYLGHLFEFEKEVPQLLRKKIRIEQMNLDKVKQVIEGVSSFSGSNIHLQKGKEDQLVEKIFTKIKGEEKTLSIQLPYLQVFLDKLYLQISEDETRQAEATFTLDALSKIGDIGDVLRDFLEEQARKIQRELAKTHHGIPDDTIWRILSPFATLEGTKEPLSLIALQERLPELTIEAINDGLLALEKSRILRYEENQELYEIAHDSLAARIAERRSEDEITLLEVRRLIKSQAGFKEDARENFSRKQLNFITPFLSRLELSKDEKSLIETSREKVRNKRFLIAVIVMVVLVIVVFVGNLFGKKESKNQAMAKARKSETYGDSYAQLGSREEACDSYRTALKEIEQYNNEDIYKTIEGKKNRICEE